MSKLRESARDCPHCMSCMRPNPDRESLCLAHSNELSKGRGFAFKTPDHEGAIVCFWCHEIIDGRSGGLSKEAKREMHRIAAERTRQWWIKEGYL